MNASGTVRVLDMTVCDLALSDVRICAALMPARIHFGESATETLRELCQHGGDAMLADTIGAIAGSETLAIGPRALDAVCRAVIANHHAPLRAALDALHQLLLSLSDPFESGAASLAEARHRLDLLAEVVRAHFAKEEYILFPAIATLVEACQHGGPLPQLPFPSVSHPIRVMECEHSRIDNDLAWLVSFASRFHPAAACAEVWARFRREITTFAQELMSHAQFENQYVFPQALDVERTLLLQDGTTAR